MASDLVRSINSGGLGEDLKKVGLFVPVVFGFGFLVNADISLSLFTTGALLVAGWIGVKRSSSIHVGSSAVSGEEDLLTSCKLTRISS